jgi:hypothetical protein
MGDERNTQGINTVDDSQHRGLNAAALRAAPHRLSRQSREDGASLTNLEEAAP